eukprot:6209190-Pleurochrysis_carterae.AAC.2
MSLPLSHAAVLGLNAATFAGLARRFAELVRCFAGLAHSSLDTLYWSITRDLPKATRIRGGQGNVD